jgi:hypothetical protein
VTRTSLLAALARFSPLNWNEYEAPTNNHSTIVSTIVHQWPGWSVQPLYAACGKITSISDGMGRRERTIHALPGGKSRAGCGHGRARWGSSIIKTASLSKRFISRLKFKIQAWRHVYDNICIRRSLALVEAVRKKLSRGK